MDEKLIKSKFNLYILWLPNREKAFIPPQKLINYLLSPTYPVEKSKAKFFSKAEFNRENYYQLKNEILRIAHEQEVLTTENTPYEIKYIIEESINIPESSDIKNPDIKIRSVS
jgi:hypothetical protein